MCGQDGCCNIITVTFIYAILFIVLNISVVLQRLYLILDGKGELIGNVGILVLAAVAIPFGLLLCLGLNKRKQSILTIFIIFSLIWSLIGIAFGSYLCATDDAYGGGMLIGIGVINLICLLIVLAAKSEMAGDQALGFSN